MEPRTSQAWVGDRLNIGVLSRCTSAGAPKSQETLRLCGTQTESSHGSVSMGLQRPPFTQVTSLALSSYTQ